MFPGNMCLKNDCMLLTASIAVDPYEVSLNEVCLQVQLNMYMMKQ